MPDSRGLLDAFGSRVSGDARLSAHAQALRHLAPRLNARAGLHGTHLGASGTRQVGWFPNIQHLVDELRSPQASAVVSPALAKGMLSVTMEVIRDELALKDPRSARYFNALVVLAMALGRPVHVFTLNFDPCVESIARLGIHVEAGFGGHGPAFTWDMDRFLDPRGPVVVFLYKLHGSLDWRRTEDNRIYTVGPGQMSGIEDAVIVLGHEAKSRGEFPEPYEHYRRRFLDLARQERQAIVVGYGFGDAGINDMLSEFVTGGACDRLTVVNKAGKETDRGAQESHVRELLGDVGNVRFLWMTAKNLSRAYTTAAAAFGAVGLGGWLHRRLGLAATAGGAGTGGSGM